MKTVRYFVSVVRVDDNDEEKVFAMDFEYDAEADTRECVIDALDTSYHGCVDED